MKPLSALPSSSIKAVFSDLDDTLTEKGQLNSATLQGLERLAMRNIWLVIVSGRPAGWADALMRLFPLDAVIFENGAGMMVREKDRIRTELLAKDIDFGKQKKILEETFKKIKTEIPKAKLATDQRYRLCDYAVDFNEEPPFLNDAQVDKVMAIVKKNPKLTAKLSSIHVNYWYGNHTKVSACEHLIAKFGKAHGVTKKNIVFSGDSPNDEPLFAYFPNSVGVANVRRFLPKMKAKPKFIAQNPGGTGFLEIVKRLTGA